MFTNSPKIIWILFLALGLFGVYMVKYEVQALKIEVAETEKQLKQEKKNLHILSTEWAFLTRPERLKQLADKYLQVKPMRGQQIVEFASLPYNKPQKTIQQASGDKKDMITFVSGGQPTDDEPVNEE